MAAYRKVLLFIKGLLYDSKSGYASASLSFKEDDLDVDAKGKVFLVTGANSGIGFCVCKHLAKAGGVVHMVCRNRERGLTAKDSIVQETGNEEIFLHVLDLSNIVEVIRFAASFAQDHGALDVLVNNAGEMIEKGRANETDGLTSHLCLDLTFATNSLGPYMLTVGLLPLLKASQNKPRVIFVASAGMLLQKLNYKFFNQKEASCDPIMSYAQCKRHQVVLIEHWATICPTIHFSAMHPGWVDTAAARRGLGDFYEKMKEKFRKPEEGADTVIWLGLSNAALAYDSGQYFQDRRVVPKHLPLGCTKESKLERNQFLQHMEDLSKKISQTFMPVG